ncbi:FAD-binding oxidoreductase [Sedimentitalea sp. XS_ASV28]|uniref:FAD-binding oxidoreductase n=1 Tax=Sedimentitalea sp. XS_ASV28 TaxID=3241296 RepID=UPI00351604F2
MMLNPADADFAAALDGVVPSGVFREIEPRYLEEPRGRLQGRAGLLACPRTTQEVAALIRAAHDARVGVVPYGGGTGLVGGQVLTEGPAPLILSLERMNAIRAVHADENVIVAEAGAILADLQAAARAADRLFPLSLASEGSARIGGNLATNAGGVNVLRYGNTRDLCLGLEAVLPDGRIWNGLTRLRKDNTGYDLRNLLIGSEGTLGVITAAALRLAPIPARSGTAIFVVASPRAAIDLLSLARDRVGEGISAFELLSGQGFDFLSETLPDIRQPFDTPPEWCVLIELGLIAALDPQEQLAELFEAALERDLASDGLIAQSEAQRDGFWMVREQVPEANRRIGSVSSHDVSIPLRALPEFIAKAAERISEIGDFRINCFGHLGDGNLHYNIFPPKGADRTAFKAQSGIVARAVHDLVAEFEGSISAEHGIGRSKVTELEIYGDPTKIAAMRAIKSALDPQGIMNPGAVLRL